jgi:hypothetical protein
MTKAEIDRFSHRRNRAVSVFRARARARQRRRRQPKSTHAPSSSSSSRIHGARRSKLEAVRPALGSTLSHWPPGKGGLRQKTRSPSSPKT